MTLQERKYQDRKCPICRIKYFKYSFCDLINNNNEDKKDEEDTEDNEDNEDINENNEDEDIDEIQNMTHTFFLIKYRDLRYAMKKTDKVKMIEQVDEWLNIYRTQDGSGGRLVLMSRYNTLNPIRQYNPRTKKIRLFRRLM
jgi:hypothetical protein